MNPFDEFTLGEQLDCLASVSDRTWALLGAGQMEGGSCFIVDASDSGSLQIAGYYDGATGDVFDCTGHSLASAPVDPGDLGEPAVHVIGALDGQTGQVTVRQEQGNYLRICRWDRLQSESPSIGGALLRTLPQCGCGGSLGTPRLFGSFAEMSAYNFCAFYLA